MCAVNISFWTEGGNFVPFLWQNLLKSLLLTSGLFALSIISLSKSRLSRKYWSWILTSSSDSLSYFDLIYSRKWLISCTWYSRFSPQIKCWTLRHVFSKAEVIWLDQDCLKSHELGQGIFIEKITVFLYNTVIFYISNFYLTSSEAIGSTRRKIEVSWTCIIRNFYFFHISSFKIVW